MEIKRDRYLNLLISKKHNGLIKVITGMRRCGKSYLLFTLFKDYLLSEGIEKSHIIEIAFDAYENKQYRDPDVLYPYLKEKIKDDGMYYVLLDEVQLLGEFEAILNSLTRMKNVDVYVTGSNARFLSKDVITEFRGRGDEVHMYPLSFAEFMSVYLNSIKCPIKVKLFITKLLFLLVSLIAHLGYCIRCWTQRRRALSMTCAASGLFPSKLSTPP